MATCRQYIEAIRRKTGWNYSEIAARLHVTKQAVHNYRSEKSYFDDAVAERVAQLLELDPVLVYLDVQIERNPASPMAHHLKKKRPLLGKVAAWATVAVAALPALIDQTLYYVKSTTPKTRNLHLTFRS